MRKQPHTSLSQIIQFIVLEFFIRSLLFISAFVALNAIADEAKPNPFSAEVTNSGQGLVIAQPNGFVSIKQYKEMREHRIVPGLVSIDQSKTSSDSRKDLNAASSRVAFDNSPIAPSSITELAKALRYDPDLIYQYVHDNIEFSPSWGIQKGAGGAILDNQGTAADQASLMVQLLRASGYEAKFVEGGITLTAQEFMDLFAQENLTNCTAINLLGRSQIPAIISPVPAACDDNPFTSNVTMLHVWVKVKIDGTDYVFDPAFKKHEYQSGIDIGAISGLDLTAYTNAAMVGATQTSYSIQSINRTNIRNNLNTYASNLAAWLRINKPTATLDDVIGGARIIPTTETHLRQTSLPYRDYSYTEVDFNDPPNFYRVTMRMQLPGIDETFFMDDIYGKRLTITYNASRQPILKLDGNQVGPVGTAGAAGTKQEINFTVLHNAYWQNFANQNFKHSILVGGTFYVANSVGFVGRGLIQKNRTIADENSTKGIASTDESVLGSSLGVLGAQYSAQVAAGIYVSDKIANVNTAINHIVGIAGYASSIGYVDFGGLLISPVNNTLDESSRRASSYSLIGHLSILESTSVNQVLNMSAVSTVRLIDQAVVLGQPIYDATAGNFSGTVSPNLTCTAAQKTYYQNLLDTPNRRLILPKSCAIVQGTFTGFGLFALTDVGSSFVGIGAIISGGIFGGAGIYTCTANDVYAWSFTYALPSNPGSFGYLAQLYSTNFNTINYFNDPIDMVNGNFQYEHTDMSVGVGDHALTLVRQYSSGINTISGPFGKGWTHNYDSSVSVGSDGFQGMGEDSALDAVGALVEYKVAYELFKSDLTLPLNKMVISTLGAQWFGEQLIDNTVLVKQGLKGELFVKLPDGTYNPPPGKSSRLTLAGGVYTYETVNREQSIFNLSTATNGANKIASYTLPNGYKVLYTYSGANLTSVKNSVGRVLTFTNTSNRITQVADGNGRTVKYVYDTTTGNANSGTLLTYTDSLTKNTTYQYEAGRMTKLFYPSFPSNAAATNTYDSLGRVQTQTNAVGGLYNYYFAGSRSEEVGPNGRSLVSYLDSLGNITKSIDPLGRVTLNTYDGLSRLMKKQLPEGNTEEYTYDDSTCANAEKRCTQNIKTITKTPKPGSTLEAIINSFTYESSFNKVATATDARNKLTTYTYTAFGSPLTVTSPTDTSGIAPVTTYSYTTFTPTASGFTTFPFNLLTGQTIKTTSSNTVTNTLNYNTAALKFVPLSTVQDSGTGKLNITNTYTYDAIGNMTVLDGPRSDVTDTITSAYDAARQAIQVTDGLGKLTKLTYDADGRVTIKAKQIGASWLVSCTNYSASGKELRTWGPAQLSSATTCPYPASPIAVTDYTYDLLDRAITVTQNLPATEGGNRVSQTNYNLDDTVQSTLQAVGTPLAQTYAAYTYTLNGLRETVKDAKNNQTTYTYDGFDRLAQTNYPDPTSPNTSSATDYTQASYDANSNVTSLRTRKGTTITQTWDNLNRLIIRDYPNPSDSLQFSYDLRGLKTLSKYTSASDSITNTWDNLGRLQDTTAAGRTISYLYDAASNRTRTTWPDSYYATTSYDALNRPLIIKQSGSVNLVSYAYDDLSRRTTTTLGNSTSTGYLYDDQGNLASIAHDLAGTAQDVSFSYAYNQLHEIKNNYTSNSLYIHATSPAASTYQANGLNQYATQSQPAGTISYGYDENGNLNAENSLTRGYDEDNRLTSQSLGSASLSYDSEGRLIKTTISGTETQLLYDGVRLVAEYDNAGTLLKRYVHGSGVDEPAVVYDGSGTTTKNWYYANHQGSIIALADSSGVASAAYTYSAEGVPGGTAGGRFRYTGQQNLDGLGMYYYKARMYSYELGRFLQTDSIGIKDNINLYAYAGNNSLNKIDPSGNNAVFQYYSDTFLNVTLNYMYVGTLATWSNQLRYDFAITNLWNNTYSSPIPVNPVSYNVSVSVNSLIPTSIGEWAYYNSLGYTTINVNPMAAVSNVNLTSGDMTLRSTDSAWTAGHESGHIMGLPDLYYTTGQNPRTTAPMTGWGGNVMSETYGIVDYRNITSLVNTVPGLSILGSSTTTGRGYPSFSPSSSTNFK